MYTCDVIPLSQQDILSQECPVGNNTWTFWETMDVTPTMTLDFGFSSVVVWVHTSTLHTSIHCISADLGKTITGHSHGSLYHRGIHLRYTLHCVTQLSWERIASAYASAILTQESCVTCPFSITEVADVVVSQLALLCEENNLVGSAGSCHYVRL